MRVFLDTSAFARLLLLDESSRDVVARIWNDSQAVIGSELLYPETHAALACARRMRRVSKPKQLELQELLKELWGDVETISPDWPLIQIAADLCSERDLRAFDAVHLATALVTRGTVDLFVAADARLLAAAHSEGLVTAEV